jgi:long-chain acyl-CoA synthetase
MPPNYTYGLSIINTHLFQGGNIILTNSSVFEKNFWEMIKKFKVTNINGVPYFYEILKKIKVSREKLPNLKFFTAAGGALDVSVYEYFKSFVSKFNIKFFCMYGQTEATSRISILSYIDFHKNFGSIGKPLDGGNLYIDKNKDVGELCYEGKNVCLGYAKDYKDLKKDDENKGILKTGDIAKKYKNNFYIIGRKKRFAKIYGHRINLDEIQKKLHDSNMKCVCIEKNNLIYILTDKKNHIKKIKKEMEKQSLKQNYFKTLFVGKFIYNSNGKISYSIMKKNL